MITFHSRISRFAFVATVAGVMSAAVFCCADQLVPGAYRSSFLDAKAVEMMRTGFRHVGGGYVRGASAEGIASGNNLNGALMRACFRRPSVKRRGLFRYKYIPAKQPVAYGYARRNDGKYFVVIQYR